MEISNNLKLDSFLKREKSLLPNILSIMFAKIILEAMVPTILSFVDNLLNLEHMKIKVIFPYMEFFHCTMIYTSQVCKLCFKGTKDFRRATHIAG